MITTSSLYAEIWRNSRREPIPEPKYSKSNRRIPVHCMSLGTAYELYAALVGYDRSRLYHLGHTEEIVPLSKPRGFPKDMNAIYEEYFENGNGYGMKRYLTWFMVQEVIDYDWDRRFPPCTGYVRSEYAPLFCTSASLPDGFPDDEDIHFVEREGTTKVSWAESYRDFVGCIDEFIEELLKLGDPEEVRIIFWLE